MLSGSHTHMPKSKRKRRRTYMSSKLIFLDKVTAIIPVFLACMHVLGYCCPVPIVHIAPLYSCDHARAWRDVAWRKTAKSKESRYSLNHDRQVKSQIRRLEVSDGAGKIKRNEGGG